jgi:hypothetical protein
MKEEMNDADPIGTPKNLRPLIVLNKTNKVISLG